MIGTRRTRRTAVRGLWLAGAAAGCLLALTVAVPPAPAQATGAAVPSGPQIVTVNGTDRHFIVHLPAGYTAARHYPVLIAFHGLHLAADGLEEVSGLDATADHDGFIVVYPSAENDHWNLGIATTESEPVPYRRRGFRRGGGYPGGGPGGYPGGGPGGYPGSGPGGYPPGGQGGSGYPPGQGQGYPRAERARPQGPGDDLAFFDDLLARLRQEYDIDAARVYLAGMGEGGMMGLRLACARARDVAAVAMVGGALPKEMAKACVPSRPVSLLMINGTKDPVVHYGGGTSQSNRYPSLSAADTAKTWAKMDNCPGKPERTKQAPEAGGGKPVELLAWQGCAQSSQVRFASLPDAGGAWPGGDYQPEEIFGTTSQALNASQAIWSFVSGTSQPSPAASAGTAR